MRYETFKEAGYKYLYYRDREKTHHLYNTDTKQIEVFASSKNYAGWALKYKNTHLEFCASLPDNELQRFIQGLERVYNFGEQHPGFKGAYKLLRYTLTPEKWQKNDKTR